MEDTPGQTQGGPGAEHPHMGSLVWPLRVPQSVWGDSGMLRCVAGGTHGAEGL